MKKAACAAFFMLHAAQLRSAFAFFDDFFAVVVDVPLSAAIVLELPEFVAPAVEPEFMELELDAPMLPAFVAAVLPAVEPCAAAPPAVPPGVPVVPIGVFCVLRWPAPTAGSVAGAGGVPCAKARLKVAAAAAARILGVFIVQDSLKEIESCDRLVTSPPKIGSSRKGKVSFTRGPVSDGP
jgi:hypothetical protein